MLTVRLPEMIDKELADLAKQMKVTKTEIVKDALTDYFMKRGSRPYEAGKDLFGCDDSDIADGSSGYKERFVRNIHEKHTY